MSEIKVLMVGASRSGKSSILASMMHECSTTLNQYRLKLEGADNVGDFEVAIASMSDLCNNISNTNQPMPRMVNTNEPMPRMTALKGTQDPKEYRFHLKYLNHINTAGTTDIVVYDVPGEFYETSDGKTILKEYVKQCQILIVAIDTPALSWLNGNRDQNYENLISCKLVLNDLVDYLGTAIDEHREDNKCLKSIIFTPIKCEYYIQHDSITFRNSLLDLVNTYYGDIINSPSVTAGRFKVSIIPMETIGGVVFDHYTEEAKMKVLYYNSNVDDAERRLYEETENETSPDGSFVTRMVTRCEVIDSRSVRIARTGELYELQDGDTLKNTIDMPGYPYVYRIDKTHKRTIPYIWYIPTERGRYEPKNCNKALFEIIKLTIQQVADDFINKNRINNINDIFNMQQNGFAWLWSLLVKMLGFNPPISNSQQLQELCKALKKMEEEKEFDYAITLQNSIDPDGSPLKINQ